MPAGDGSALMDQRAFPRVPLVLPATLTLPGAESFSCLVTDISGGGAGLNYLDQAPEGERVATLDIGAFGRFEGTTVRDQGERRGLRFLDGEAGRNRSMPKLILYVEEGLAELGETDRWSMQDRLSLVRTTGIRESCDVLDISLQGVSVITGQRPPVGELVRLGRMYGRVTGHLGNGIQIGFLNFVSAGLGAGVAG
jgi:PilZ domain-containing protein